MENPSSGTSMCSMESDDVLMSLLVESPVEDVLVPALEQAVSMRMTTSTAAVRVMRPGYRPRGGPQLR